MPDLVYERGDYSASEVQDALAQLASEIRLANRRGDFELPDGLGAEGLDAFDNLRVRDVEGGFGGVGEALVIAAIVMAAERLLDEVLIPELKRRYGSRVIGKRKKPIDPPKKPKEEENSKESRRDQ